VLLLVGLAFAAINATKKPKPVSQEELARQKAEALDFLDKANKGNFTPPDTPLVLAVGEVALLNEQSELIEARATRVYAGGGTRVQGIYIGGGQSSSVQALKQLDSGVLTLTTKRLVFTGSMESRVANVKDIVSVENYADAIEISTARKAKRQVYAVRNPMLWGALLRNVISGGVSVTLKPSGEQIEIPNEPAPAPAQTSMPSQPDADSAQPQSSPPASGTGRVIIAICIGITAIAVAMYALMMIKPSNDPALRKGNASPAALPSPHTESTFTANVPTQVTAPARAPGRIITLTQPVSLQTLSGNDVTVPVGTELEFVSQLNNKVHVRYMSGDYIIPLSATDLNRKLSKPVK
jgi:hypothetical protein